MKKRILCLTMSLLMAASVFAGCSKANQPGTSTNTAVQSSPQGGQTKPVSINVFVNSPEYADAMNAYIAEYKKVKPNVTVNLETIQSDYPTMLKAKINSGDMPDVFASTAGGEIKAYAEYSADLTDQPLAKAMTDAVRTNMSYNGKVYGFPIKANAFGMLYNKEIFEKNGLTPPKTLAELQTVCDKLKAAGVQPFTTGYKEWWVFKHAFMHFFDASQPNDVGGLVNSFIQGKAKFASYPIINNNWFKFVDMTVKYGDAKPLETDLSAEEAAFATGKAAMVVGQGPWVEADVVKINPNIKIGFTGYPTTDNPKDAFLAAGADQATRIYKDSKVLQDTLDLYNWLYTSDYGKKWFSDVAKVIPPIKDAAMPNMQITKELQTYLSSNKAGDLYVNYSLDSFHQKFGEIMQGYIAKTYTKEKAIKEIETVWPQLGAAK